MADRLTLELATPTKLVVTAEVDEVVVPGSLGYFGVLPGHAPLLATLGIGEVTYPSGREQYHVAVSGGFAEIIDGKHDELPEQAFYMVGTIENAVEKGEQVAAAT